MSPFAPDRNRSKMTRRALLFAGLLLSALFLTACGDSDSPAGSSASAASGPREYPYRIVATVGMVADIARNVAGDKSEVVGIIGEGVDPHLYKPTRSDTAALQSGDIIFYSGLLLEGKMSDTLIQVSNKRPVFPVTQIIDETYLLSPPEFAGHHDPHVWMDASAWARCVEAVGGKLAEFDPANAELYKTNAAAYASQLQDLHAYAKLVIGSIPEGRRTLVTAHDAFNYFGRAYGIEVLGIQGISTESEAGLEDINRLVDMLVEKQIPAVFVETSVSDKNIRALIEGAASRGHTVKIGGSLYSDAMGPPGSYEGTYIGMIDHNATTIARALGGEAPVAGMNGKLTPRPAH